MDQLDWFLRVGFSIPVARRKGLGLLGKQNHLDSTQKHTRQAR